MTPEGEAPTQPRFAAKMRRVYGWYTGGFLLFIVVLALLERRAPASSPRLPLVWQADNGSPLGLVRRHLSREN